MLIISWLKSWMLMDFMSCVERKTWVSGIFSSLVRHHLTNPRLVQGPLPKEDSVAGDHHVCHRVEGAPCCGKGPIKKGFGWFFSASFLAVESICLFWGLNLYGDIHMLLGDLQHGKLWDGGMVRFWDTIWSARRLTRRSKICYGWRVALETGELQPSSTICFDPDF